MKTFLRFAWLCCALLLGGASATAADKPVLQVTGKVAGPASFDLAALEKLPQHSFKTNSPWTKEPREYKGPLLREVLKLVQASGTVIKATALNDYQINIPVEDARLHDVIVATRIDGKLIPVRERGPLFVIYPFDLKPELQGPKYYDRSIWQLKSIQVD